VVLPVIVPQPSRLYDIVDNRQHFRVPVVQRPDGVRRQRADLFRAKRFRAKMHKGTFPRAEIRARKRTLVHLRAETLRAEKIGALFIHSFIHSYLGNARWQHNMNMKY